MRRVMIILAFLGLFISYNAMTVSAEVNRYCLELVMTVHNPMSVASPVSLSMGGGVNGYHFYVTSKTFSLPAGQTKTYAIHHFYPADWITYSSSTSGQIQLLNLYEHVVSDSVCLAS